MRNDDVFLQLYLIRHAESMGNIKTDEVFDRANPPLTDFGRKQAQALGKRFAENKPDVLYSSPLIRARETAESLNMPINIINDLRETETGMNEEGFYLFEETDEACFSRAKKIIDDIKEKHRGQSVALVSHGGLIQWLIKAALGIKGVDFCVYNASISKINFRDLPENHKLALQNDISHLEKTDGERLFWM